MLQVPNNSRPLLPGCKSTPSAAPVIAYGSLPPLCRSPQEIAWRYLHPAARAAAAVFTREQFVRGDNFPPGSHPAFPCTKRWDSQLSRGSDILPVGKALGAVGGFLAPGWPTMRWLQGEEQ